MSKQEKKKEKKKEPAPAFDLESIAKNLAEQIEKPTVEILKEINDLIKDGYSQNGAVATFKSKYKNLLGKKQEFYVRVLGKDSIRQAKINDKHTQRVTNIHLLTTDVTGAIDVKNVTLWGDRTEMSDEFKLGLPYFVKAKERAGKLTYMSTPEPCEENKVPSLWELPEKGIQYAKPGQILDYVDKLDLFHGWIGKLIRDKQTGTIIGFELSDAESYPATCWCGERYGALPPELKDTIQQLKEGDEVLVYAFVSLSTKTGEPHMNVKGLFVKPQQ